MLTVNTKSLTYNIYFETNFKALAQNPVLANVKRLCVITDSNVAPLYLAEVRDILSINGREYGEIIFEAGEHNKHLTTISSFYKKFLEMRLERDSLIIALGGGVCGDMAGFAAATYLRGIPYAQIPTTLLAQVDSSVGGKTGVDFGPAKNIVGAFWQPSFVYINAKTLETLPKEQFASGMAEALKHGLIKDEKYFNVMAANADEIKSLNADTLIEVIKRSVEIKAAVVAADERESNERELLNFGHTFGHAVESLYNFALPHGHCVAIGIIAALQASGLGDVDVSRITDVFRSYDLPVFAENLSAGDIYNFMAYDKKNRGGNINLIVLEKIGHARRLPNADEKLIKDAINSILKKR